MHTNCVPLAPLDYSNFITGCQFIPFPDDFSVMQESGLSATCSAGALAVRTGSATTSAPTPGLPGCVKASWARYRLQDCGWPCLLTLTCSALTWVLWDCTLCWRGDCYSWLARPRSLQEVWTIKWNEYLAWSNKWRWFSTYSVVYNLLYSVVVTKYFMFMNLMKEAFTGENKDKYGFKSLVSLKSWGLTECSVEISLHAWLNAS